MALNRFQSMTIFCAVVVVALAFVGLEIYYAIELVDNPTLLKGGVSALGLLAIGSAFQLLKRAWEKEFLSVPDLTGRDIQKCFSRRHMMLEEKTSSEGDICDLSAKLITVYLELLEQLLSRKIGAQEFAISIFCDAENPKIVAYYDSNSRRVPRSKPHRDENPKYYVEKGYEVVKLLNNPSTGFIVKTDLMKDSQSYNFVTGQQRRQIRSTILYAISPVWPAAIVVTCNKAGAFSQNDQTLKDLIRGLGSAILLDLDTNSIWAQS